MSDWSECYEEVPGGVVLRVHVQPRASRAAVVGRHGDAVKVRVQSPPVDDRANAEVRALLAGLVGVTPRAVAIVAGGRSRAKRVRIDGIAGPALEAAISQVAGP
jgi:uncharacterized protein (TIGR00251 family)